MAQEDFTIAAVQFSPKLGVLDANLGRIVDLAAAARDGGADVAVFPELAVTGYLLRDMVASVARSPEDAVFDPLRKISREIDVVVGFVEESTDHHFYNSAMWLENGEILHVHRKVYLPTYGMFDEQRYFGHGRSLRAFATRRGRVAIRICEDLWHPSTAWVAAYDRASLLVCPSASPVRGLGPDDEVDDTAAVWEGINRFTASLYLVPVVYANRSGFEDGIAFRGGSEIVAATGREIAKAPLCEEATIFGRIDPAETRRARLSSPLLRDEEWELTMREIERIRHSRGDGS